MTKTISKKEFKHIKKALSKTITIKVPVTVKSVAKKFKRSKALISNVRHSRSYKEYQKSWSKQKQSIDEL